ncbi:MAG: nitrous oxide reductase family maturation protein NosD [Candidatus Thorarchaeota archaeon]
MHSIIRSGVLAILVLTWLVLPLQIVQTLTLDNVEGITLSDGYTHHGLIFIDGNEDFLAQAALEGWPGSGTAEDPIVITRFSFASSDHLFEVLNSDLYFEFKDNQLDGVDGVWCTIYLGNVTNGAIMDCRLWNGAVALHMSRINNCIMSGNEIFDNTWEAIAIEGNSRGNLIENNYLHHNEKGGISLWEGTSGTKIHNNTIAENQNVGIEIPTNENAITGNTIFSNEGTGIRLYMGAESNIIQDNTIHDNAGAGVSMNAIHAEVTDNLLYGNSRGGIELYFAAEQNLISTNIVLNNSRHGVIISDNSQQNTIENNDFVNNGEGCQAYDEGQENHIRSNYWCDWTQPDEDQDGVVDNPYAIEGEASNADAFPKTTPNLELPEWYTPASPATSSTTEPTGGMPTLPPPIYPPAVITIGGSIALVASIVLIYALVRRRSLITQ